MDEGDRYCFPTNLQAGTAACCLLVHMEPCSTSALKWLSHQAASTDVERDASVVSGDSCECKCAWLFHPLDHARAVK